MQNHRIMKAVANGLSLQGLRSWPAAKAETSSQMCESCKSCALQHHCPWLSDCRPSLPASGYIAWNTSAEGPRQESEAGTASSGYTSVTQSSTGGRTSSARDLSLVISNHRLLFRFPPHGARNFSFIPRRTGALGNRRGRGRCRISLNICSRLPSPTTRSRMVHGIVSDMMWPLACLHRHSSAHHSRHTV